MKKGFTLAEILGVIVIIGLLLILIVPPIINRISGSGDEAKDAENEFIYNAADVYINEHPEKYPPGKSGKYCILIQDLIDDGLLVEPVNDVVTGEDLSDKSVLVTIYSTGTKEYEIKEGAECKDISALPMIDFIIEPTGSSWVKQRKVTIIYPTIEGEYQARYRREDENSNNWINDNAYNNGGRHTNIIFNKSSKSTKIEAQLKGNQIISGRVNVVNVDSVAPTITNITSNGKNGNSVRVNITAKDNLSGLDGIYFTTSKIVPNENASGWIDFTTNDSSSKTYSKSFSVGTYYVYVKDKAGNISAGNKNGITISNATYHPERWYCPSGYTSSGSGSSMRCSKTTYTNATYHERQTISYTVTGSCICPNGACTNYVCRASSYPGWNVTFISGGCDPCQEGASKTHCSNSCRRTKPAYYTCSSGTLVGTRCRHTTTRSPYHESAYYSCSSGTLVGTMCFKNS